MLTGEHYINAILDVYVKPYAGAVRENFILMEDNICQHKARVVDSYLESETIQRLDWPACSPDANPIDMSGICCRLLLHIEIGGLVLSRSLISHTGSSGTIYLNVQCSN